MSDLSRRRFIQVAGIVSAGTIVSACVPTTPPPPTPEAEVTTPDEALERLMRGNARFVTAMASNPNQTIQRREQVAGGQMPFAIVLGCSDSRVPPEIIFDQGLGDLFVVRVAGNLFDDNVGLGSMEYAAEHFHSPLLMVLGHAECGAVKSTIEAMEQNATVPGRIGDIVDAIKPIVEQVRGEPGNLLENSIRANVLHVVEQLVDADPYISKLQADGKLKIVGGVYALDTGKVNLVT
jgi:carbonic anhydrase